MKTSQNDPLCLIEVSVSNFNPLNIPYIPAVNVFVCLTLEEKTDFFKGLIMIPIDKILKFTEKDSGLYMAVAICAALKVLMVLPGPDINPDGVLYIAAARCFAAGHFQDGLALYPMPLYPLLITSVHYLIPDWALAARMISVISITLVMFPLYFLSKLLFNARVAFWSGLAYAVSPAFNEWSPEILRGPCFALTFMSAVYFACQSLVRFRPSDFFWVLLFSVLSVLFRIEGVVFFLVYLGAICVFTVKKQMPSKTGAGILLVCLTMFIGTAGVVYYTSGAKESLEFSRFGEIIQYVNEINSVSFLDNYHKIYEGLKDLEQEAFFPGGKQNLAELARHYMPLLYLIGLFHLLIKALFPSYLIPLWFGLKKTSSRPIGFLIVMFFSYMLLLYFVLIKRDFLQTRFLKVPALLLFPWLGAGLEHIASITRQTSKKMRWTVMILLCLLLAIPLIKTTRIMTRFNTVTRTAGTWIAKQAAYQNAAIITTDARIPFYAGRLKGNYQVFWEKDYEKMERTAIRNKKDLLIIKTARKRKNHIYSFQHYRELKKFAGKKDVVLIFKTKNSEGY
jgi:hypothetical protein